MRALPRLRRDLLGWLAALTGQYGDVVALPAPRRPMLLLNDPDAVRRVLRDNHRGYDKGTVQYAALARVTGPGLLAADGPAWRRHRRLLQPGFHSRAVAALVAGAAAAGDALADRWATAGATPVEAEEDVAAAAAAGLAALLGPDAARHAPAAVRAADDATRALLRLAPLPAWLPAPDRSRLRRANAELDAVCRQLLAGDRGTGVLALLRDARDRGALTEQQARDELVTLLVAGQETVAAGLAWTLHRLAAHPAAQDRLQAELDTVLAGRDPAPEHLAELRWTRAVLDESLRLHPPAWLLTRRALAPDVLAGVPVEAGTVLVISPWLLHRRAADWPAPEEFRPERFLAAAPARERGYLPFGAGPRLCIGREVALVGSVALLAGLLARVRLRPVGPAPGPTVGVSVRPRGLRLLAAGR